MRAAINRYQAIEADSHATENSPRTDAFLCAPQGPYTSSKKGGSDSFAGKSLQVMAVQGKAECGLAFDPIF